MSGASRSQSDSMDSCTTESFEDRSNFRPVRGQVNLKSDHARGRTENNGVVVL